MSLALPIKHLNDKEFHSAFLSDLTVAKDFVVLLSPFISSRRVGFYLPTFSVLYSQQVDLKIYLRPRSGQPESLQRGFDGVVESLRVAGAQVHLRAEMHEKIAVIDGRILWHGSLNALSHANTLESMLRFESAPLAREILADLNLGDPNSLAGHGAGRTAPASEPTSACPQCGEKMNFYPETGLFLCHKSPLCSGVESATQSFQVQSPDEKSQIACPVCGELMLWRQGLKRALICPDCGFRLQGRLASALLRVVEREKKL